MKKYFTLFLWSFLFTMKFTVSFCQKEDCTDDIPFTKVLKIIDTTCKCYGNFIIDSASAVRMIDSFRSVYVDRLPELSGLDTRGWINVKVVEAMFNLLNKRPTLDGFRIYFGADPIVDPVSLQNKISFIIVPTVPQRPQNGSSTHKDVFIKLPIVIPMKFESVLINLPTRNILEQQDAFRQIYRQELGGEAIEGIDSLSRSVWLDSCVIRSMYRYTKNIKCTDGFHLYPAAYRDKSGHVEGQVYSNQSTLVIVPTRKTHIGREDDWHAVKILKLLLDKSQKDIYNHGELCPNKCP